MRGGRLLSDLCIAHWRPAQSEFAAYTMCAMHDHFPNEILCREPLFSKKDASNPAAGLELVRYVRKRVGQTPTAIELEIRFCFLALPNPFRPARNMVVVVVLMNHRCNSAHIHDWQTRNAHCLDQPVIEPQSPDGKVRNVRIHPFLENENVNARRPA